MTLTTTITKTDENKKWKTISLKIERPLDALSMTEQEKKDFMKDLEECEAKLLEALPFSS